MNHDIIFKHNISWFSLQYKEKIIYVISIWVIRIQKIFKNFPSCKSYSNTSKCLSIYHISMLGNLFFITVMYITYRFYFRKKIRTKKTFIQRFSQVAKVFNLNHSRLIWDMYSFSILLSFLIFSFQCKHSVQLFCCVWKMKFH